LNSRDSHRGNDGLTLSSGLLEEKGIHKEAPGEKTIEEPAAASSSVGGKADTVDKPSKLEKLKEKLHLKKSDH
jgi:hypothetical protein